MTDIDQLIEKAKKGDSEAYLSLFQIYQDDIYRIAFVYMRNKDEALDVVQETAYRSFKNISTIRESKFIKTWLLKIAISSAIDLLRKSSKVIPFGPQQINNNLWVSESLEQNISLKISLDEVINKLDATEKGIVLLRFYKDYTFKEISQILNIPLGSTKTILYRALEKMKLNLKEVNIK